MRVAFITPEEYAAYGLPATTSEVDVQKATSAIEDEILRPVAVTTFKDLVTFQEDRDVAQLSFPPIVAITSVRGRLIPTTRGTPINRAFPEQNLFLPADAWTTIAPAAITFTAETGDIWVNTRIGLMSFNELEVTYQGGWATVPEKLKEAVALLVERMCLRPSPDIIAIGLDDVKTTFATSDYIDAEIRRKTTPFKARSW
jgi:hypothetical protein